MFLYYIILYYVLLYYIMFYYIIFYYIVLYFFLIVYIKYTCGWTCPLDHPTQPTKQLRNQIAERRSQEQHDAARHSALTV